MPDQCDLLNRRQLFFALISGAALPAAFTPFDALVQGRSPAANASLVSVLEDRARAVGFKAISVADRSIGPVDPNAYIELFPRLLDIIEGADVARPDHGIIAPDASWAFGRVKYGQQ